MINAGRGPGETSTLSLDLNSKNPFRNRTSSPADDIFGSAFSSPGPASPFGEPSPGARPLSTNPFLDPLLTKQSEPLVSLGAMSTQPVKSASPTAEELFVRLDYRCLLNPQHGELGVDFQYYTKGRC